MADRNVFTYGSGDLETVRFFHYKSSNNHSLVYIHGGAWRDPNNTFDDFLDMAAHHQLFAEKNNLNLVGINYKLAPQHKHPSHIRDVARALHFLVTQFGVTEVLLVGHSAGATLALQLLDFPQYVDFHVADFHINTVFFVDGIYDLPDLLAEYSSYRGFVEEAFRDQHNATQVLAQLELFYLEPETLIVIQSVEDELLSPRQLERFLSFLLKRRVPVEFSYGHYGKHEEVYRCDKVSRLIEQVLEQNR